MRYPSVSVVLPTYKRAHLLKQAMQSVLEQSYDDLELIIVDDNSPDETRAIVASFSDKRIRYFKNDPNLKLPKALNRGFNEARGNFLTWTSDDNLLSPTAIEKMVDALSAQNCDFVYADCWMFSEQGANGEPITPKHERLPDVLQLERGNHIGACFMYTRALYQEVGDYDPELFLVEDYDYFLRAAKRFRFFHIAEPLYYFRRDDATLYCSRFAEVKASDVLVRFKNGVMDTAAVADTLVGLLLQHPNELKSASVRLALAVRDRLSFRFGSFLFALSRHNLVRRLNQDCVPVFNDFQTGEVSFADTRDAILKTVRSYGRLAYRGGGN